MSNLTVDEFNAYMDTYVLKAIKENYKMIHKVMDSLIDGFNAVNSRISQLESDVMALQNKVNNNDAVYKVKV